MVHWSHCADGNSEAQGREDEATCPRSYRNLAVRTRTDPRLPPVPVAALGGSQGISTRGRRAKCPAGLTLQ